MEPRRLAVLLGAWALVTAIACAAVRHAFLLEADPAHPRAVVASVWRGGQLVARAVLAQAGDHDAAVDAAAARAGATLVHEAVVAEGPVLAWPEAALSLSFVPGRDGLAATVGGRTAYVTPDELVAMQAYDRGIVAPSWQMSTGVDVPLALAHAADALGVPVRELLDHGTLRRVRVERSLPGAPPARVVTAEALTVDDARNAAIGMGRYLARSVDGEGRFRYLVNAPTNQTLPGYDWPRHAGATYFLAQIAALTRDPDIRFATLRSAAFMRDGALQRCGEHRCIGSADEPMTDVGSSALALLAFVEIARTRLDEGYGLLVPELAAFLRAQQRPDGDLMHVYDRRENRPVDVQLLYYTGEASLALARAHALTGDARDLDAATRALAFLVGPSWSFFGSRYYFGEEHWTCQAMDDLWDRAPRPVLDEALDFCLRWHAYGRELLYAPGQAPFDADGAYGMGPVQTPHLTPVGSRTEAALATLEAARKAGRPAAELAQLEQQSRRSLALLVRHQLRNRASDRAYLLADPVAVDGAMPGSEVDWQLRIDFSQHAGCALLRWLSLEPTGQGQPGSAADQGKPPPQAHPPNE